MIFIRDLQRIVTVNSMRIGLLLTLIVLISCSPNSGDVRTPSFLDTLKDLRVLAGDSVEFKLTKGDIDKHPFRMVDSLFYSKYMAKDFGGYNVTDGPRGYSCYQHYFAIVGNRKSGFRQLLVFQEFTFNDQINTLFLMTFDNKDSLKSVLPVASLIFQAEIEPIFRSILLQYNDIVKYEVTRSHIPDDVDTLNHRLLFCTDSVTKWFDFELGD